MDEITLSAFACLIPSPSRSFSVTCSQFCRPRYRDKDQVEVDFVLESPLRDIGGAQFCSGIVLYDGEQALPFGDRLWAVPLGWL